MSTINSKKIFEQSVEFILQTTYALALTDPSFTYAGLNMSHSSQAHPPSVAKFYMTRVQVQERSEERGSLALRHPAVAAHLRLSHFLSKQFAYQL